MSHSVGLSPLVREQKPPICVDLDGTLIKTDLLVETILSLVKSHPLSIFTIPLWLLKGRAELKHQVAARASFCAEGLPYQKEFLTYLTHEHQAGRRVILATASHERFANLIADHLKIFSDVIATKRGTNLAGSEKLDAIKALLGSEPFVYAGNSAMDLKVWRGAKEAILVDTPRSVEAKIGIPVSQTFGVRGFRLRPILKLVRVHQWTKNLLIFLPVVTAHQILNQSALSSALVAALAFSLCASAVYITNDLLDLASDRSHPRKKYRPLASGDISLLRAIALVPLLLASAAAISFSLPREFSVSLGIYFAITTIYSAFLKRVVIADVLCLATLYTLRIYAGSLATGIPLSSWLLHFGMFFFLSLALLKRYAEVDEFFLNHKEGSDVVSITKGLALRNRSYLPEDRVLLLVSGVVSGFVSVLIFVLYLQSAAVQLLYSNPNRLGLIAAPLIYWIFRIWMLVGRRQIKDDPVSFASTDVSTYLTLGVIGLILLFST